MIKLIVIILILLFVYYIGYFLYSMVNKGNDRKVTDKDDGTLYNVDVTVNGDEINYIDVPSELESLEAKKKKLENSVLYLVEYKKNKNQKSKKNNNKTDVATSVVKDSEKEKAHIAEQSTNSDELDIISFIMGGKSVDELANMKSDSLTIFQKELENIEE